LRKLGVTKRFEVVDEKVPLDAAGNPDAAALPELVRRIAQEQPQFLYVPPSTFLAVTHRDTLTQAALAAKLPTFCVTEAVVRKSKCMYGLFASGLNVGRFAGFKAAQVLADKVPVEKVPAETLQRFSLLVNMPVAIGLGMYPPLPLLDAAEIVEK
jgi:putative tryptophan/tyrosine transport system substrate-binding protein